jgi:hypothetical protein
MEEVVPLFAAAIPVGHRVEVSWYAVTKGGLFGSSREERPHEPVVTDLDTGVEYLSDFALKGPGIKRPNEPLALQPGRKIGDVIRTLRGRVSSCRVVTVRAFSEIDLQTYLAIERDG